MDDVVLMKQAITRVYFEVDLWKLLELCLLENFNPDAHGFTTW